MDDSVDGKVLSARTCGVSDNARSSDLASRRIEKPFAEARRLGKRRVVVMLIARREGSQSLPGGQRRHKYEEAGIKK